MNLLIIGHFSESVIQPKELKSEKKQRRSPKVKSHNQDIGTILPTIFVKRHVLITEQKDMLPGRL